MEKTLLHVATHDETGESLAIYQDSEGVRACSLRDWELARAPKLAESVPVSPDELHAALKRVFGYDQFRTGQESLIRAVLAGRDALGVMPTGSGKSICYQLPALLRPGVALVVSPLISLMKDQVGALTQSGVAAAYLNSSLTERQFQLAMDRTEAGQYRIVYVAPERLLTPRFLAAARRMPLSLIAVDEAHCLSQWGQDFRPSYLSIPEFIRQLPARPPVCAFTATATEPVRVDIARLLALRDPFLLTTGFDRPNLLFRVIHTGDKRASLLELIREWPDRSGIVYCATRKNVEQVCEALVNEGVPATRYHAGLSDEERLRNQDDFSYDRKPVMVATNAFGMGIDKPDVRFVLHFNMPKDLESYYQEAGRAGRDGEQADCVLLFSRADIVTQRRFVDRTGAESELSAAQIGLLKAAATERLNRMVLYCQTAGCLRQYILRYFGEDAPDECALCDNCLRPKPRSDQSDLARAVLDCVLQTGERFGAALVGQVLRASKDERVARLGLDELPIYGALKGVARPVLNESIEQLIEQGCLRSEGEPYAVLKLGEKAEDVLSGRERVFLRAEPLNKPPRGKDARGGADPTRFAALRALRGRIAAEKGVPAYMIFSDATLRALCERAPRTQRDMLQVPGVGQAKWHAFGKLFLEVCQGAN